MAEAEQKRMMKMISPEMSLLCLLSCLLISLFSQMMSVGSYESLTTKSPPRSIL